MRRRLCWVCAAALACITCAALAWEPGQDLTGQELNNKSFAAENLNKACLDRAKAKYANFRDASMKKASLVGADLRGANFRGANLENADFTGAKLEGACFTDAKAWRANFSGCDIYLARAVPLDLETEPVKEVFGAAEIIRMYDDATSGGLTFRWADLHDALILGNAAGVDFRDADLRGADLGHAENVDQALLKGAKYDTETRWTIDPKKAGAVFQESDKPNHPRHPLAGKWIILKGFEGARDHGVLNIWRDNTFEWDAALSDEKPKILPGVWTEKGDKIELVGGEDGRVWTAEKVERNGKAEILLTSDKGEKRIGVAD